jgi:hypothetical protein
VDLDFRGAPAGRTARIQLLATDRRIESSIEAIIPPPMRKRGFLCVTVVSVTRLRLRLG